MCRKGQKTIQWGDGLNGPYVRKSDTFLVIYMTTPNHVNAISVDVPYCVCHIIKAFISPNYTVFKSYFSLMTWHCCI